jgi:glutathione S-transferase
VVTETYPICLYILHAAGCNDLLGKTIEDEAKVDMFVWETELMCQVLGILVAFRDETPEKKLEALNKHWETTLKAKFLKLEATVTDTFYLSYMTVVDFFIYEIVYFFTHEVPQYLADFPKLLHIYERMASIPQIAAYENSPKAIKEICPAEYFNKWKSMCPR